MYEDEKGDLWDYSAVIKGRIVEYKIREMDKGAGSSRASVDTVRILNLILNEVEENIEYESDIILQRGRG